MSRTIFFGTNLNFARYVWSPRAALDIAREQLGLRFVEPVADSDFGPALYLSDRAAFTDHHREVGRYARELGIQIPTVFTYYRDGGAVYHRNLAIRSAALQSLVSLAAQAAAVGAQYACASLMTATRDEFDADPAGCRERALKAWGSWMSFARSNGLKGLLLEMSAQPREECATIAGTRATLEWFREHHQSRQSTSVPVHLCYDLGHGMARAEEPAPEERSFRAWFEAFPSEIREVHLKNTDPDFLATWPFTEAHRSRGIISPPEVIEAVRDVLTSDVYLMLEVAGKQGREVGERTIVDELRVSVDVWKQALTDGGYTEQPDGSWQLLGGPESR